MAKKKRKTGQTEDILAALASAAISEMEGIAPLQNEDGGHFQIYISDDKVFADININALFGYNVPELAYSIQTRVKRELEYRTRYTVEKVNVNIVSAIMPI
ncbi:MAG: Asp23/Gls24 family envelope stress response protein [Clostridiales bacterium]|jgi:uncharacterized alkaline shock family protein YloU|nr:Asp23/Gls24 family envelope stress response protein [Clostridiales bacterium]